MRPVSRREALAVGAAFVCINLVPPAAHAEVGNDAAELISKFTGGKEPAQGRITLDLPEIAENGNTVPLLVMVDSPMTSDSHVSEVLVVADGNPNGGVATMMFTPASGRAEAAIRIRLAQTQNVIAVAKMSDGSMFSDHKVVKVTIGGCGG